MNRYFLESISPVLLFRALGMIIVERATRIYIFYIFGYVRNLYIKGREEYMGTRVGSGWGSHIAQKYIGTCL